jgi:hypothetical protein
VTWRDCCPPELEPKCGGISQAPDHAEFSLKSNASLVLFAVKEGFISKDPDVVYARGKVS